MAADRQAGHVTAREDATKLCCVESPVAVEIQVGDSSDAGTPITLSWKVPGFGPVASRALRTRETSLEARIRAELDRASVPGAVQVS